ncbi:MAG: hemerythrin domain-containing protein [Polyangiaceae bacterium]|nr:hemerythrin domain-containing protein [Polyangiaceae bacterium]
MVDSPYAASHKGLRNALGRFQLQAGATDYTDPGSVASLRARGAKLEMLLTHHLAAENRYFLDPLRKRDAAGAEHDLAEHERLEVLQRKMFSMLASLHTSDEPARGRDFYLLVTEFHASYLQHILHEERVTEPLLFARFTEEEVARFSQDLVAAVELPVLLASLEYIVPAQPVAESRALLARLREAPFYPQLINALRAELDADALAALLAP